MTKFLKDNFVLVVGLTLPILLMIVIGFVLIGFGVLAVTINNRFIAQRSDPAI